MTLLDAQQYDEEKARKRTRRIITSISILVIVLGLVWWFRYWPEERIVGHFFDALQKQDYKTAYGIWMNDPNWEQHPQNYDYKLQRFTEDWTTAGEDCVPFSARRRSRTASGRTPSPLIQFTAPRNPATNFVRGWR